MEEWQIALDELYSQYKKNGVIYEEDIFNIAERRNLPLLKLEKLCSELASKGAYISSRNNSEESTKDIYDYAQIDYNHIYTIALEASPTLETLISQVRSIVPPQKNELSSLLKQLRSGNTYARERAITMHMRMVIRIAVGYIEKTEVPLEDLVSEGTIGLMTAIDRYDESIHGYFSSYASLWIRQVLDRYVLYQKSLIHIPVHAYDLLLQIEQKIEPYPFDSTIANINKLATEHNISIQETERAIALLSPFLSLDEDIEDEQANLEFDEFIYGDEDSDIMNCKEMSYYDIEDQYYEKELHSNLLEAMKTLTEKERRVLSLRTGFTDGIEYTLEQVGNIFGVTRERIRQIEAKAIRKLRHPSRARKIKDYY